jgi:hypothetical protein
MLHNVKRIALLLVVACLPLAGGCSDDDAPDAQPACAIAGDPELEVGVPDTITFLDFEPLAAGADIPLSSNGQTFLAVQFALRARNLSTSAHIGLEVTYQPAAGPARIAVKDDAPLERLFCRSDDRLYLIPVVVSSEDLGDDVEIQDQSVDVKMTVTDDEGRTAEATATGVLRRFF